MKIDNKSGLNITLFQLKEMFNNISGSNIYLLKQMQRDKNEL